MDITLDTNQQLFVIKSGNSVSCHGFRVVFEEGKELLKRIQRRVAGACATLPAFNEEDIGTQQQYAQYRELMAVYLQLGDSTTWFDARTPKAVQRVIEQYRKSGDTLRIFNGDAESGLDWMCEFETIGRVGRSSGPIHSPLLIEAGEYGGSAILTHCIVRMVDGDSGSEVYRHPAYHQPVMRVVDAPSYDVAEGLTHNVEMLDKAGDWGVQARFKSAPKASHWLAFMAGETNDRPD